MRAPRDARRAPRRHVVDTLRAVTSSWPLTIRLPFDSLIPSRSPSYSFILFCSKRSPADMEEIKRIQFRALSLSVMMVDGQCCAGFKTFKSIRSFKENAHQETGWGDDVMAAIVRLVHAGLGSRRGLRKKRVERLGICAALPGINQRTRVVDERAP